MKNLEESLKNKIFNDLHSVYEMLGVDLRSEIDRVEKEMDKLSYEK